MKKRIIAIVLATSTITLGAVGVQQAIEQHQRDARCAAMGEVWQGDTTLEDGSFMPGQCVDGGFNA